MLDSKQLQYFVTAAACGSFSEAATLLFTTQSNVSKTVAQLEKYLGYQLFQRISGGIRLTPRGNAFYNHAAPLVDYMKNLEAESKEASTDVFRISTTPSSWFAHRFSEFYTLHDQEKIHYHVHTDSTANVIQRMRNLRDDVGFVYVFPDEQENFYYDVKRYGLDFEVLGETCGMLYSRPHGATEGAADYDPENIALVQGEMDTYRQAANWLVEDTGKDIMNLPVAVTTNSDYIMNIMMKQNGLWNVSMKTFPWKNENNEVGYRLINTKGNILYGVLRGQDPRNKKLAEAFIGYIRQGIQGELPKS